ncbi:hypothetical protein [Bradyrhizobium prioriisuperbiae]|uniref:hypothetical protein n=1 Tax=Bradyrhizobium prioriisuperbiae TaxID=2854389 RepID=UPI0028EFCE66|nr:hypothetical protein [Bradyrhizobium prioritasuperba]
MASENWQPPHARVRVPPGKERERTLAEWIERCRRAAADARMTLREIFLEPRPDSGEWDSGARGL